LSPGKKSFEAVYLWFLIVRVTFISHRRQAYDGWLVQKRFPVGRHFSRWSRSELISRVRMRRKQLYTLDHRLLVVIEEPILTRLKTGYDLMSRRRRML
jgi:hypothetical protein